MIRQVRLENYKSIQQLELELGRITVLIGENGCGKSNILEALALGAAAANNKLDNEFLVSRGIRVTEPPLMRAAFEKAQLQQPIKISLEGELHQKLRVTLNNDNEPYSKWTKKAFVSNKQNFSQFLIYSPEHISLRTFEKEGQIQPLGIHGEGLLKLLKVLSLAETSDPLKELKEKLQLIDWFKDFEIAPHLVTGEASLSVRDKYLDQQLAYFDQKSANEGFWFLLFYFALFISPDTPNFFAIDNLDASLNPRLCRQLLKELVGLATKHEKQVIITTHNPAVLDGLNLHDEEQRLLVVYRNKLGHTKVRRIEPLEPLAGQEAVKLSEAFLRGYLGGLPKNF